MPALAQTEPPNIAPEVVVTADRIPTDKDKVTGTVTVITNEEMQRRQLRTLDEVLRWVPGVSVQQSGRPGSANIGVRARRQCQPDVFCCSTA